MQFVRCASCGAKALPAASSCPKCGAALNLRNDDGTLVPLSHCRTCDTHYPRAQGACKWCNVTSAGGPVPGSASRRTVVAALVLVTIIAAGVLLLTRHKRNTPAPGAPVAAVQPNVQGARLAATSDSTSRAIIADSERPPAASTKPAATANTPEPSADADPWVPATARMAVYVRAAPERTSAAIGTVPANASVELGESRLGWRRIRTATLAGWVDPRLFTVSPTRP